MIKCKTVGMLDVAKVNPVLTSASDVVNYSFLYDDGDLYLIANQISGDDAYIEDVTIKAGEFLNGYLVKAWESQRLVIDAKHITFGSGETYEDDIVVTSGSETLLAVDSSTNELKIVANAPASGVYFVCKGKVTLTEKAVEVKVMVVDAS